MSAMSHHRLIRICLLLIIIVLAPFILTKVTGTYPTGSTYRYFPSAPSQSLEAPEGSIGVLTPFYRAEQLQGAWMETLPGYGLIKIPAYLTDPSLDYPYLKKNQNPSGLEVPYVSTFSIQRTLGGWEDKFVPTGEPRDSVDLIRYDKTSGTWITNYDQFTTNLKRFLDAGYQPSDITINIDNIPWDLSTDRCPDGDPMGKFGNRAPIQDYGEWQSFVEGFARAVDTTSSGHAGDFRYKIGTEMNTLKSFCADISEYEKEYRTTVEALSRVIREPKVMPFEFAGDAAGGGARSFSTVDFYRWAASANMPIDAIARSANYFPGLGATDLTPLSKATSVQGSFDQIIAAVPTLKDTPLEIHQFGVSALTGTKEGLDIGPRLASWYFQTMFRLVSAHPYKRIMHWDILDRIPIGKGAGMFWLPTATSWLYQVLDNLQGTAMYVLKNATTPSDENTMTYTIGFLGDHQLTILASTFNKNLNTGKTQRMSVTIPSTLFAGATTFTIGSISLSTEDTPSAVVKDALRNGEISGASLAATFTKETYLVGAIGDMAADRGGKSDAAALRAVGATLAGNGPVAQRAMMSIKKMFTLEPYDRALLTKNNDGSYALDAGMFEPGEMKLFRIDFQ